MHSFDITPKEAIELQKKLREEIRLVPLIAKPKLIGGCDVSMNRFAINGFAGFVTLDAQTLRLVDHAVVEEKIPFPYIPGLLSFREIPMLLLAWKKLKIKPDVLVADGVGIAHPRRMGIATHLGLVLGVSTIGCAKSVLVGEYKEPKDKIGAYEYLYDPKTNEVIGAAVRTKLGVKPVFVSPGHLITLEDSVALVLGMVTKYRLPEPIRMAHNTVNDYRIAAGQN